MLLWGESSERARGVAAGVGIWKRVYRETCVVGQGAERVVLWHTQQIWQSLWWTEGPRVIGKTATTEPCTDSRTHGYQGPTRNVRIPRATTTGGGAIAKSEDGFRCAVAGQECEYQSSAATRLPDDHNLVFVKPCESSASLSLPNPPLSSTSPLSAEAGTE